MDNLTENPIEFSTVPKTKREPVWFSAVAVGDIIIINETIHNKPSSKLSMKRKLEHKTLKKYILFI